MANCFQIFNYDVPREQLKDCALEISVKDYDILGRNEMIGNVIIDGEWSWVDLMKRGYSYLTYYFLLAWAGNKKGAETLERRHWREIVSNPGEARMVWYKLRRHSQGEY